MAHTEIREQLYEMLETLAAIEHERWSHWQRYLHSKGELLADGSLSIPRELVAHWQRQMSQAYEDLPEAEKQSDRDQVRIYLDVIVAKLEGGS